MIADDVERNNEMTENFIVVEILGLKLINYKEYQYICLYNIDYFNE